MYCLSGSTDISLPFDAVSPWLSLCVFHARSATLLPVDALAIHHLRGFLHFSCPSWRCGAAMMYDAVISYIHTRGTHEPSTTRPFLQGGWWHSNKLKPEEYSCGWAFCVAAAATPNKRWQLRNKLHFLSAAATRTRTRDTEHQEEPRRRCGCESMVFLFYDNQQRRSPCAPPFQREQVSACVRAGVVVLPQVHVRQTRDLTVSSLHFTAVERQKLQQQLRAYHIIATVPPAGVKAGERDPTTQRWDATASTSRLKSLVNRLIRRLPVCG